MSRFSVASKFFHSYWRQSATSSTNESMNAPRGRSRRLQNALVVGFVLLACFCSVLPAQAQLQITQTSLPAASLGNAYPPQQLTVTGGTAPLNWFLSGSLPPGMSIGQTTGIISGTPSDSGTFNFTVQVFDANSQTTTRA